MLTSHGYRQISFMLVALFLMIGHLSAHDYWLQPKQGRVAIGEATSVQLMFGENFGAGKEKPLQLARTTQFRMYGNSRKFADLLAGKADGISPAAQLSFAKEGTMLVAMERSPADISFGRGKFLSYAAQEGNAIGDQELPATVKRVHETYARYLKTLVQVGASESKTPSKKIGQKYEIIPLGNPFIANISELTVKVLFEGKPAAGVKVSAIQKTPGKLVSTSAITDKRGRCALKISPVGEWLIRSVKIIPDGPSAGSQAEYHSYWASLTFGY